MRVALAKHASEPGQREVPAGPQPDKALVGGGAERAVEYVGVDPEPRRELFRARRPLPERVERAGLGERGDRMGPGDAHRLLPHGIGGRQQPVRHAKEAPAQA